jgi:hypothetical protein
LESPRASSKDFAFARGDLVESGLIGKVGRRLLGHAGDLRDGLPLLAGLVL